MSHWILLITLALAPFRCHQHSTARYLSVCAIFQNEAQWLREWIEYHRLIGVEYFLLYNNGSSDDWQAVLQPYIEEGVVRVIDWGTGDDPFPDEQIRAYNHSLRQLRRTSEWVAYIDIDEFIVPIECDSLADFLRDYEEYGGVVLNWRTFGTGGVELLDEGELLIEALQKAVDQKGHETEVVKSIVRPRRTLHPNGVHRFFYRPGFFAVDTNFERSNPIEPRCCARKVLFDRCLINHYRLRTCDWAFGEKARRNAHFYGTTMEKERSQLKLKDDCLNKITNLDIQRFVPSLKERLGCPS